MFLGLAMGTYGLSIPTHNVRMPHYGLSGRNHGHVEQSVDQMIDHSPCYGSSLSHYFAVVKDGYQTMDRRLIKGLWIMGVN